MYIYKYGYGYMYIYIYIIKSIKELKIINYLLLIITVRTTITAYDKLYYADSITGTLNRP